MKQMRKIEYALLQQKKHHQVSHQTQQHSIGGQGASGQASTGPGSQQMTAVAQSISINNTQNNTIISNGNHGSLVNEQN